MQERLILLYTTGSCLAPQGHAIQHRDLRVRTPRLAIYHGVILYITGHAAYKPHDQGREGGRASTVHESQLDHTCKGSVFKNHLINACYNGNEIDLVYSTLICYIIV